MKLKRLISIVFLFLFASLAHAANGLISIKSPHSPADTMNRFEEQAIKNSFKVFARIDHAAGAAKIGKTLRPTEVLIFGNPQGGTPLMACAQSMGIDLPLKALVWQDESAQTWLSYNDPAFLAKRHGVKKCAAVKNVRNILSDLATATVAR
jgi:uncharacterized protein (DUF302 family)